MSEFTRRDFLKLSASAIGGAALGYSLISGDLYELVGLMKDAEGKDIDLAELIYEDREMWILYKHTWEMAEAVERSGSNMIVRIDYHDRKDQKQVGLRMEFCPQAGRYEISAVERDDDSPENPNPEDKTVLSFKPEELQQSILHLFAAYELGKSEEIDDLQLWIYATTELTDDEKADIKDLLSPRVPNLPEPEELDFIAEYVFDWNPTTGYAIRRDAYGMVTIYADENRVVIPGELETISPVPDDLWKYLEGVYRNNLGVGLPKWKLPSKVA